MTRQAIIERTIHTMNQLPDEKIQEVSNFAAFISLQLEESQLTQGIQKLINQSNSFEFLNDEEDLYSEADIKEDYNAKR